MKLKQLILLLLVSLPVQVLSIDLPRGHALKQNEQGDYFVVNDQDIIMIEPSIMSLGYTRRWILACIENTSIDSDQKRMVFINLKNGGTTDTINQDIWENFQGIYPELTEISMESLQEGSCP